MRTDVNVFSDRGPTPQRAALGAKAAKSAQGSLAQAQGAEQRKLREVAQEFESLLLEHLFKEMRDSIPKSRLLGKDSSMDTFQEMLDGEFSRAMAHRGGIGLADFMVAHMKPGDGARAAAIGPSSFGEKGRDISNPGPGRLAKIQAQPPTLPGLERLQPQWRRYVP